MAYNGVGTFLRLYRWVNDAANGLFINAQKFDAEMDGMATGLSNCITRDGQSPPTADIPMGGHKLTGLGSGTLPGDAATVAQLPGEWFVESSPAVFVSGTSFKVTAVNKASLYHAGRRIYVINPGASYQAATIVSSSFVAPDTVVNVALDSGALVAGFTDLHYGLISYGLPALSSYLSPRTAVYAEAPTIASSSSGTPAMVTYDDTGLIDALGEFDSTAHKFIAKYPGLHRFTGNVSIQATGAISSPGAGVSIRRNGAVGPNLFFANFPGSYGPGLYMNLPFHYLVNLNVGEDMTVWTSMSGASWATSTTGCNLIVERIV